MRVEIATRRPARFDYRARRGGRRPPAPVARSTTARACLAADSVPTATRRRLRDRRVVGWRRLSQETRVAVVDEVLGGTDARRDLAGAMASR